MPDYEIEYGGRKYVVTYEGALEDVVKALPRIMPQVLKEYGEAPKPPPPPKPRNIQQEVIADIKAGQKKPSPFGPAQPEPPNPVEALVMRAVPGATLQQVRQPTVPPAFAYAVPMARQAEAAKQNAPKQIKEIARARPTKPIQLGAVPQVPARQIISPRDSIEDLLIQAQIRGAEQDAARPQRIAELMADEPPVLAKWLPGHYPPGEDLRRVMWEYELMKARGQGEENLPTVKDLGPLAYIPGIPQLMGEQHPSALQRIGQVVLEQLTPEGLATNIAAGGVLARVPGPLRSKALKAMGAGFGGGSVYSGVQRIQEGDTGAGAVDIGLGALLAGLPYLYRPKQAPQQADTAATPQEPSGPQWYEVEPQTPAPQPTVRPERVMPRAKKPAQPQPAATETPAPQQPKPVVAPQQPAPPTQQPVRVLPRAGRKPPEPPPVQPTQPVPTTQPAPLEPVRRPRFTTPPSQQAPQQPTKQPVQPAQPAQPVQPAQPTQPKPGEPVRRPRFSTEQVRQQGEANAIPQQETTPGLLRDEGVRGQGELPGVGQEVKGPQPTRTGPKVQEVAPEPTKPQARTAVADEPVDLTPDETGRRYRTRDGDEIEIDALHDLGPRNESMYRVAKELGVEIPEGPRRPPLSIVRIIADTYMKRDPTILETSVRKAHNGEPLKVQEAIVLMSEAVNAGVRATRIARQIREAVQSGKATPEELQQLADEFDSAKTAFSNIETANRIVGSRTSFMLNMRRVRISDDNLPAHRIAEYMARTKGKITPDDVAKIERLTSEEIAARNEADALDRDLWDMVENSRFWRTTMYQARRVMAASEKARIARELRDIWSRGTPYEETINATPQQVLAFAKDVARSARLLAELGTKSAADALEIIFNELGPKYPNISKATMARVLAEGPENLTAATAKYIAMKSRLDELVKSQEEAAPKVEESVEKLRRVPEELAKRAEEQKKAERDKALIARLKAEVARLEKQIAEGTYAEEKSGGGRAGTTRQEPPEAEGLRARIKELQKQIQDLRKADREADSPAEQEAAKIKRLEKQIAELQRRLDEGDVMPRPREPRGPESPAVQRLRAEVERLQKQIAAERRKVQAAAKERAKQGQPLPGPDEQQMAQRIRAAEQRLERKVAALEQKIERARQGEFEEESVRKVRELSEREKELRRKARGLAAEYEYLKQSHEPEKFEEWLKRYRLTNMLSSMATQTLNFSSNILNMTRLEATRVAQEALAGRNDLPNRLLGLHEGLRIGLRNASQIIRSGYAPSSLPEGIIPPREFRGGLRNPYNWVGRFMRAGDAIFFETAKQSEIASLAAKLGQTPEERIALRANPTEEMVAQADRYAREVVFRVDKADKTLASEAGLAMDAAKAHSDVIRRILDWGLPFHKIALEITRQGVNLTPGVRALQMLKKSNREQWRRAVVDTALGSSAMLAGYSLYQQGRITMGYPKDELEKMQWNQLKKEPYSIYLGGRWVSIQYLGPMVIPLVLGAALGESTEHHKKVPKASWAKDVLINNALYNAMVYGKGLTQTSPLTSINMIVDALSGERPSGTVRLPANLLGQLVPMSSFNAGIAKVVDRTVRDPDDTSLAGVWETLLTRTPYASKTVAPKKQVPPRSPSTAERIANYMLTRSGAGKASPQFKATLQKRPKPPTIEDLLRMPSMTPRLGM